MRRLDFLALMTLSPLLSACGGGCEPAASAVDSGANPFWCSTYQINTGLVSTLAGGAASGYLDAVGTAAMFGGGMGIASDASGNLYVADQGNGRVRKVDTNGLVTTLAGTGAFGGANGPGSSATFIYPTGVAVDAGGNYVYVVDASANRVRRIDRNNVVTTLAGSDVGGVTGYQDGPGSTALFMFPGALAVDVQGNVYVSDQGNLKIRKITPSGVVSTFFDFSALGWAQALAVDASGNVYAASNNLAIYKITPSGVATVLAGNVGAPGDVDGIGTAARFGNIGGLALDTRSGILYATDTNYNKIRKIDVTTGSATTFAGDGTSGYVDGVGTAAKFVNIRGIAMDACGILYVTDQSRIRKIT